MLVNTEFIKSVHSIADMFNNQPFLALVVYLHRSVHMDLVLLLIQTQNTLEQHFFCSCSYCCMVPHFDALSLSVQ